MSTAEPEPNPSDYDVENTKLRLMVPNDGIEGRVEEDGHDQPYLEIVASELGGVAIEGASIDEDETPDQDSYDETVGIKRWEGDHILEPRTNRELVTLARHGDKEAFSELISRTNGRAHALARRMVSNEEDVKEVVQIAYLRAYRGIKKFREESEFTTWLHRIVVNSASSFLAKSKRQKAEPLTYEDGEEIEVADTDPSPEDKSLAAELGGKLKAAFDQLPPSLRVVAVLFLVYGLAHNDIAKRLGISETASKVRLHRARKQLMSNLSQEKSGSQDY